MADEQKKLLPINYTNREFEGIRQDLLEIAERLYPDSFQDFSEASFGSLMVDAVAYVGDQLSFYLDYNVNESFLDTAYQYDNVLRHGRILGYKYTGRPSTYGKVAIFALIPASQTGLGPDNNYLPILKRGSRFSSANALNFVLTENVDFAQTDNPVVVAKVDGTTGAPTYFAIKAYGNVVSGQFGQEEISVGAYEKFKKVTLSNANVSEIISVFDSEGHEYFEVDYLAQDMVYKEVVNSNYKNDNVPSILKPVLVARKFVVEHSRNKVTLQFGSGKEGESNVAADPQAVAMDVFGKTYVTDLSFDPTRLSKNENFGIVPAGTTLRVIYRSTNPTNSNVAVGQLNTVSTPLVDFSDRDVLTPSTAAAVISSVEVNNEEPIVGNVQNATAAEIKRRVYDTFPTQNRAVTQADYENLAYRMPAKFGSIKRTSVQRDPSSRKRNLNMYVMSTDPFGKLIATNDTIKNNLKTWINNFRMINDTVDIIDPYIINLGINFAARIKIGADKYSVLGAAVSQLKKQYSEHFYIGEQLSITDIYQELKKVDGILDVTNVQVINKTGTNYSSVSLDINKNLSPDGTYIMVPKNAILEIKYPATDIIGKIK
tara:strand:- start:2301 stop:4097 length:1797 start_codon:yes stop_codon:yes gene_type:complete